MSMEAKDTVNTKVITGNVNDVQDAVQTLITGGKTIVQIVAPINKAAVWLIIFT